VPEAKTAVKISGVKTTTEAVTVEYTDAAAMKAM
jgi:hypothetical protein